MLKRAAFCLGSSFSLSRFTFPPSLPSRLLPLPPVRLLFPVSFAAKTNATYLSADTAGLPSSSPPASSSQRAVILGVHHPLAGSEDLVRRESAAARRRVDFFSFLSLPPRILVPRYVYVSLRISHARWRLLLAESSS